MRIAAGIVVAALVAGLGMAGSAVAAPECKDAVTGKARSAAQVSDTERERRARENAIVHWRVLARQNYGWRYRFWSKAEDKQVTCAGGKSAKHCTVSAKPCRLL